MFCLRRIVVVFLFVCLYIRSVFINYLLQLLLIICLCSIFAYLDSLDYFRNGKERLSK